MKRPTRKFLIAAVLLILLSAAAFFAVMAQETRLMTADLEARTANMSRHLKDAYADLLERRERVAAWGDERLVAGAELTARGLRELVAAGEYTGPRRFDDGAVVCVRDGKVDAPEGFAALDAALFDDGGASRRAPEGILTARHISGDWYYVQCADPEAIDSVTENYVDTDELLDYVSQAYGGDVLMVDPEDGRVSGVSETFEGVEALDALGLTPEALEAGSVRFAWRGEAYHGRVEILDDRGLSMIFISSVRAISDTAAWRAAFVTGMLLMLLLPLCVWLVSVQLRVRDGLLTEAQKAQFHPARVRRRAVRLGLLCILALALLTGTMHGVSTLFEEYRDGSRLLDHLAFWQLINRELDKAALEVEKALNLIYAERAAELVALNPALQSRERLTELNGALGADFIMLYDDRGRETVGSGDYVDFALSDDPESPDADFRRVLKGVHSVAHDPAVDPVTGLEHQLTAVRLPLPDDSGRCGLLMLAMPGAQLERRGNAGGFNALSLLMPEDSLGFGVDQQTLTIVDATDPTLPGNEAAALGLTAERIGSADMDIVTLYGVRYYAVATAIDGVTYYYALSSRTLMGAIQRAALMAAALMAIACAAMFACLLAGYDAATYAAWAQTGTGRMSENGTIEIVMPNGQAKQKTDPAWRWRLGMRFWRGLTPAGKGRAVFRGLLCVFAMYLLIRVTLIRMLTGGATFSFLFYGRWPRGVNLFAVITVGLIACEAEMALTIARLLERLLCSVLDAKGETVCRLLFGLVRYVVVLVALYFAFDYFGFDTRTLLASVGLLSLALSLGARELVTDVLAGIAIVSEDEFEVGDIIEVGGYRGTVQEIGVRATKILGRGDNIRIVNNRDVKNVTNMTRLNSWYAVELSLKPDQPLDEVEAMLEQALPEIGKRIPEIISGPYYKGIVAVSSGKAAVSVIAECHEDDYHKVQRSLNKALYQLFRKHHIPLL